MAETDDGSGNTYEPWGAGGEPDEPDSRSDLEPSSAFSGEEFLFHLYRGSELLQDNCVTEAKDELERALSLQPRDVEGQGLLGIVYFRLGLYPRAISIYEEIVKSVPEELTPRINLALCYLKTGQLSDARQQLEAVIAKDPTRQRAWGYLGLTFERLGDLHKARASFERAGQSHMVRRMDHLLKEVEGDRERDSDPPERAEVRRAAADAVQEIETHTGAAGPFSRAELPGAAFSEEGPQSGRWRAHEPGEDAIPPASRPPPRGSRPPSWPRGRVSVPPLTLSPPAAPGRGRYTPERFAEEAALVLPVEPGIVETGPGRVVVHVVEGFSVRVDALSAMIPKNAPFASQAVMRRQLGRTTEDPMGGHRAPFVQLDGEGYLLVDSTLTLSSLSLDKSAFVYVREQNLVGFEGTVRYENGRLQSDAEEPIAMVQLSGRGGVLFEHHASIRSVAVAAQRPLTLRAKLVLGWTGRLLTHALSPREAPNQAHGFISFSGDGAVFVEKETRS